MPKRIGNTQISTAAGHSDILDIRSHKKLVAQDIYPDTANDVVRGVRFDGSSYLSKSTSTSSTNSAIKTWSFWVKRSVLGTNFYMTGGFKSGDSNSFDIYFHTDDTFSTQWGGSSQLLNSTSAVFRDTSAWYHICLLYTSPSPRD